MITSNYANHSLLTVLSHLFYPPMDTYSDINDKRGSDHIMLSFAGQCILPNILQIQTREEVRSERNGHTGLNNFPGMPLAELRIDCRPLENVFCTKLHRLSITRGEGERPLCCHLLELKEEEHEGKEQILFACPVDVISCGWEDNKTLFSLLCA